MAYAATGTGHDAVVLEQLQLSALPRLLCERAVNVFCGSGGDLSLLL